MGNIAWLNITLAQKLIYLLYIILDFLTKMSYNIDYKDDYGTKFIQEN